MLEFFNVYGNNMIFQRGKPIVLAGNADGQKEISARIYRGDECLRESADYVKDGKWEITLEGLDACVGLRIEVFTEEECAEITDVAVGEVWLCSGQSNIECDFNYCTGTEEYAEKFGSRDIRFLTMEQSIGFEKKENQLTPEWRVINRENYSDLSVIACVFAQVLAENIDVPIGIIKNYRGGNSIVTFLNEENLAGCDEDGFFNAQLERERQEVRSAWSMIPCAFYNAMTAPLTRFSVKGMLWYQGETDSAYDRPRYYRKLLKTMFGQYRRDFNDDTLPIIMIQLCPFEMDPFDYKQIREIQRKTAAEDENIYLISTQDMGPTGEEDESAIHPKYKTPIGERCAYAAISETYKQDAKEWRGPEIRKICRKGEDLELYFKDCAGGLMSDGEVSGFEVGTDAFFVNGVKAEIAGEDKIIIKGVRDAAEVRYSYANPRRGNVVNREGIPMIPFKEKI